MTVDRIFSRANPQSKLSDLRAFFDSYRYIFRVKGKTYVECPIWLFATAFDVGIGPRYSEKPRPEQSFGLHIDSLGDCSGTLDRGNPIPQVEGEANPPEDNSRWPFWVGEELIFQFLFKTDTEYVLAQEFLFEPGRTYEAETVQGFIGGK